MIPSDRDRGPSPLPSPHGLVGSEDPEATTSSQPAGPPLAAVLCVRPTGARRFDFLSPTRAEGELGWLVHYRVWSPIGDGGTGLVFLAEDTHLSPSVALKVFRPERANEPEVRDRLAREAHAAAAIKHHHIGTIQLL